MNTNFLKTLLFITTVITIISCDKDFNEVGSNLIDTDHYGMTRNSSTTVAAYTKLTGPVQTNNLDVNPLGIYDNPVFGKTTASFVTQVQLASVAPTIPALDPNPSTTTLGALKTRTVTKVTLYIPYFTKNKATNPSSNGAYIYDLDSIVNPSTDYNNKIKLSIYENNRYLGTPEVTNTPQGINPNLIPFYSNNTDINNFAIAVPIGARLNQDLTDPTNFPLSNNDEFVFSKTEIPVVTTTSGVTTTTYKAPGMNIRLNNSFFDTKILKAQSSDLLTNAAFVQYFKGLYFKVEDATTTTGCMNMLDFKKGTITIEYKEISNSTVAPVTDVITEKSIVLNLTGNTASILQNSAPIPTAAGKHYIKGGDGSVMMIDLFGTPNPITGKFQEIVDLKNEKVLINEANLTFYIDEATMNTGTSTNKVVEPFRLFLYDARNKRPLIDYYYDSSTSSFLNSGKAVHGGIIDPKVRATTTTRGTKYTIHITDHIRNIINKDSTNVTLGLSVCKTINNQFFAKQKVASGTTLTNLNYFPFSSVMQPLGTVLWGTTGTPVGKEMKLEIYYTKPD